MKKVCLLLALIFLFTACAGKDIKQANIAEEQNQTIETETIGSIELHKLNDDLWVYTSYANYNGNKTPSNGMIASTSEGLVLIDTPWNNEQTKELIKLIKEKFNNKIVLAIITHAHDDTIGGIDALLQENIEVMSTKLTMEQAEKNGFTKPSSKLESNQSIKLGKTSIEIFYPGEGHTSDNITVWFTNDKVLFGGCMIKSLESKEIGNTEDADLEQWPQSVRSVREKYSDVKIVVPGHGKWGDIQLIDHTLELLKPFTEPPEVEIKSGDKTLKYVIAKNQWDRVIFDREDTFKQIMKEASAEDIPYIQIGETVEISFKRNPPEQFAIYDILIDETGKQMYSNRVIITIPVDLKNGSCSFQINKHLASALSSFYVKDKKDLRGYRMIASWGENECEYAFIIKTDAY